MPLSLAEKIAAVAKTVPNLAKRGDNGEYTYLTAPDVFDAIRIKLFEAGIVILPKSCKIERSQPYLTVTDDITDEVIAEVTYEITDGTEVLQCAAIGIGQDHQGKALYMASTGAKKDLLKTLFLLAGFEDDAESVTDTEKIPPGLAEKLDAAEKEFGPDLRKHPIDRVKVNAFCSACRTGKISEKEKKEFLAENFDIDKISDLKREDFEQAIKWATRGSDGTDSSSTVPNATD